jgi:hypothetical protein
MAAGPDPKQEASPLLARWRATAPGAALAPTPARAVAAAPAPAVPIDQLLRELGEALASALPPAQAHAVAAMLEPLGRLAGAPVAERKAAAAVLDQVEDVLEALLLTRPPGASP